MGIQDKYSLDNWILNQSQVRVGEKVAWDEQGFEVRGIVVLLPESAHNLRVRREDNGFLVTLNFYTTVTYIVARECVKRVECSCGAKHTSNPKYHLSYCDLDD